MIPAAWRFGVAYAFWRRYRQAASIEDREAAGRAIIVLTAVWAAALTLVGVVVLLSVLALVLVVRA